MQDHTARQIKQLPSKRTSTLSK